jgi:hypothetical protein
VLRPKIREEVIVTDFGDEIVLWAPTAEASRLYILNPSAAIVFRLCDGTGTTAELAADIADVYGQPVEEIEQQVRTMVRLFRRRGFLTAKPVARRPAAQSVEHHHHDHDHDHDHEHEHDHDHAHEHEVSEAGDERPRIWRQVPASE